MKIFITIVFFFVSLSGIGQLKVNYLNSDGYGNEYSQYETPDATVYIAQSRYTPAEKEAGTLTLDYLGVNISSGMAIRKTKSVGYRKVNGVITFTTVTNLFAPTGDTGITTADAVFAASGGDIIINITGIAATVVRHTLKVQRLSSQLK